MGGNMDIRDAIKNVRQEEKKEISKEDEEIKKFLRESKAKIKIIGCGGSGNNTVNRLLSMGVKNIESIAINTDAQTLLNINADRKILIGKKVTRGLGAGSNPQLGESAAKESMEEIKEAIHDSDLLFITCGLGGGTGTGSAPVVAEIAKDENILSVAIVTLPFSIEGKKRMQNALDGLQKLRKHVDTLIVIPNDKLLEVAPDLSLNEAFAVADMILANAVKGIVNLVDNTGLVNADFADLTTILKNGGPAMIGLGSSMNSQTEARALEAVEEAISSPLLDVDISQVTRALINVTGGRNLTLKEAQIVVEAIVSRIHPDAHIIWGADQNESLDDNKIEVMVVMTGARIPFLEDVTKAEQIIKDKDRTIDLDYI
jgi:cell division protein FtsZ